MNPCLSAKLWKINDIEGLAGLTDDELVAAVKHGESDPEVSGKLDSLLEAASPVMQVKNEQLHQGLPNHGGDSAAVEQSTRAAAEQSTRLWKTFAENGEGPRVQQLMDEWKSTPPLPQELPHATVLDSVGMRAAEDGRVVAKNPLEAIVGVK